MANVCVCVSRGRAHLVPYAVAIFEAELVEPVRRRKRPPLAKPPHEPEDGREEKGEDAGRPAGEVRERYGRDQAEQEADEPAAAAHAKRRRQGGRHRIQTVEGCGATGHRRWPKAFFDAAKPDLGPFSQEKVVDEP